MLAINYQQTRLIYSNSDSKRIEIFHDNCIQIQCLMYDPYEVRGEAFRTTVGCFVSVYSPAWRSPSPHLPLPLLRSPCPMEGGGGTALSSGTRRVPRGETHSSSLTQQHLFCVRRKPIFSTPFITCSIFPLCVFLFLHPPRLRLTSPLSLYL